MSGYKRVNYYELCRLCATNQQKEKTHIFKEEGRKMQLLNKIQSCLSLTVYEHDYLPKVVCSKCLKCLESYYTFKQECVSSETMLSSYFKNFRYTEDFKKSGKVYIKDTTVKTQNEDEIKNGIVTSCSNVTSSSNTVQQSPIVVHPQTMVQSYMTMNEQQQQQQQQVKSQEHHQQQVQSYYTVQIPQNIVQNPPHIEQKTIKSESKIVQNSQITTYNLNSVKPQPKPQTQETINNVVVNANGEVINIGQIIDLESFINANVQKAPPLHKTQTKHKHAKEKIEEPSSQHQQQVMKIELENEKLPHIKNNKFPTCSYKTEEKIVNVNPTVIFNAVQDYHQVPISNFVPFHQNSTVSLAPPPICTNHNEASTVNLNALNGNVNNNELGGVAYRNVTEKVKIENNSVGGAVSKTEKLHVCDVCHKSFKRREHLYQHIKLHTGFRPYTCENCNKSFMRKEHLLRHMTSHSGQKNYTCNICDKSFSRNDNLLKHKKTHDKQNSFTCEVCQKQFVMKHYYLAHKLTHEVVERCIGQTLGILKA